MANEEVTQRIKYLVEHGGLYPCNSGCRYKRWCFVSLGLWIASIISATVLYATA